VVFGDGPDRDPEKPSAADLEAGSTARSQTPRRILVAEDDQLVRSLLERLLRLQGWSVVAVGDGLAAVAAWEAQPGFDLAILDVRMPRLNGYDASLRMRKTTPNARFLFVSGYADEKIEARIAADGMCFMSKPFDSDALLGKVTQLLDERDTTLLARSASSP